MQLRGEFNGGLSILKSFLLIALTRCAFECRATIFSKCLAKLNPFQSLVTDIKNRMDWLSVIVAVLVGKLNRV